MLSPRNGPDAVPLAITFSYRAPKGAEAGADCRAGASTVTCAAATLMTLPGGRLDAICAPPNPPSFGSYVLNRSTWTNPSRGSDIGPRSTPLRVCELSAPGSPNAEICGDPPGVDGASPSPGMRASAASRP